MDCGLLCARLLSAAAIVTTSFASSAVFAADTLKVTDFSIGGPDEVFSKLDQLKPLAAAGKGKIALLLPDTAFSARWMTADAPAFERAFKEVGLTPNDYIISNAQASPQRQQTEAEQAITDGASIILITNLDSGSGARLRPMRI